MSLLFIARGDRRLEVFKLLYKPRTPSEIRRALNLSKKDTVYYILASFAERGITVCLNPEARKGRLYFLTDKGKEYLITIVKDEKGDKNFEVIFYDIPKELVSSYSWVVSGGRKRLIMETVDNNDRVAEEIRKRLGEKLTIFNTDSTLKACVKRGLVVCSVKNEGVTYKHSENGRIIKKILLAKADFSKD